MLAGTSRSPSAISAPASASAAALAGSRTSTRTGTSRSRSRRTASEPTFPAVVTRITMSLSAHSEWVTQPILAGAKWVVKPRKLVSVESDGRARHADQAEAHSQGGAHPGRIVEAAARLIHERGVAGTTLDDVRSAAGVSGSQLSHYFAGKDELVQAVIGYQAEIITGNQRQADLGSPEGLRAWRDMVIAQARSGEGKGGCPLGSLAGQLAETDPQARALIAAGFGQWSAAISDGLRRLHARRAAPGRHRPGRPRRHPPRRAPGRPSPRPGPARHPSPRNRGRHPPRTRPHQPPGRASRRRDPHALDPAGNLNPSAS